LSLRKRVNKLHDYINDFEAITKELEKDTGKELEELKHSKNPDQNDIILSIQSVLNTIQNNVTSHKQKIEIVREISPPVSEHLDYFLKEFEMQSTTISKKFKDSFSGKMQKGDPDFMYTLGELENRMQQIIILDEKIEEMLTITYNSFVGMLRFMEGYKI